MTDDDALQISVEFVDDESGPTGERVAVFVTEQNDPDGSPFLLELSIDQLVVMAEHSYQAETRCETIGTPSEILMQALHKAVLMEVSIKNGTSWSDEFTDDKRPPDGPRTADARPREMMWVDTPGDAPRKLALRYGGIVSKPEESYPGNLIPLSGVPKCMDTFFTLDENVMALAQATADEIEKEDTPIPSQSLKEGLHVLAWAQTVDQTKLATAALATLLEPHFPFVEGDPRVPYVLKPS